MKVYIEKNTNKMVRKDQHHVSVQYSQLSLNRHLSSMDTSARPFAPFIDDIFLYVSFFDKPHQWS